MNTNINLAASYLRKAAQDMQRRVNELRNQEYSDQTQERRAKNEINSEIRKTAFDLIQKGNADTYGKYLIMRELALRRRKKEIEQQTQRQIKNEEAEIKALQAQISKLIDLAQTLESWK